MKSAFDYSMYCDTNSEVYPDAEFEGLLVLQSSSGAQKYHGGFERGMKRVGQHLCFHENGVLKEVGWWVDGWVVGTQLWFDEEGALDVERYFGERGSRDRRWIDRHYDADTGKLDWVELYVDNQLHSQWLSEESLQLAMETRLDETVEKAIAKFFPEFGVE